MKFILASVVSAMLALCAHAYPNGVMSNASNPMESLSSYCTVGNFRPNHGHFLPQATPSPFKITVTSPTGDIYSPGKTVSVIIEPTSGLHKLKGFLLQGDNTEMSFAGKLQCIQGKESSFCGKQIITHKDPTLKGKIECTWTPPDFQVGSVRFVATIVQDFATFWSGVKSSVVLKPDPTTMTYEQKTQQLRDQMMSKATSLMSSFGGAAGGTGGAGNAFASMLSKMTVGQGQAQQNAQQGNNPLLSALMNKFNAGDQGQSQGQTASNPWGPLQQQQQTMGFDSKSLLSMFGGGGGGAQQPSLASNRGSSFGNGNSFAGFGQYFQQ